MGSFQKPEELKRLFPWSDDLHWMDSEQKIKDKLSHLINNRWLFLKNQGTDDHLLTKEKRP